MVKLDELILFKNDDLVAINKPSGLLTIPDREGKDISLKQMLKKKFSEIFTVHRLDRDTSGLVVFALNEKTHKHLSLQFEGRETRKIYTGIVLGVPAETTGVINEPIAEHPSKKGLMSVWRKGKESITEYEVVDSYRLYSRLNFNILTGRTHQIRVHMKHLGHPLACDVLYGDGKPILLSAIKKKFKLGKDVFEERPLLNRLALHASTLSFKNLQGDIVELEAPLPKDMKALVQQLEKTKK